MELKKRQRSYWDNHERLSGLLTRIELKALQIAQMTSDT